MSENTQNIILLSHGRCGTNLLCRLLSQYSCISNNNEIAVEYPKKDNKFFFDKHLRKELQKHFPFSEKFSEYIDLARKLCRKDFMLFKLFPHHVDGKAWEIISQKNSKFILLTRNHLDSFLSLVQAELYESYFLEDTTSYKIKFNENSFEAMYERRKKNLSFINNIIKSNPEIEKNLIRVNYKNFLFEKDKKKSLNNILNFLNIDVKKKSKYSLSFGEFKQNKNTNFDFVINKDEMIEYMNKKEDTKIILENSIYYKKS